MIDHQAFTAQFQNLCHAFRTTVNTETMWQYYKAFESLSEPQMNQLFSWAIENIDRPFPTIAALKQFARSQGWYARIPLHRDEFVFVDCNECGGHFAVKRSQLERDAQDGKLYRCSNYDHCPVTFSARAILEKELS